MIEADNSLKILTQLLFVYGNRMRVEQTEITSVGSGLGYVS